MASMVANGGVSFTLVSSQAYFERMAMKEIRSLVHLQHDQGIFLLFLYLFFWCIWLLILWSQFSDAKWKDEGNECLQGIFYGSDCMIFKKWGGLDVFFYWDVEDLRTIFSICICDAWKMEFWTACLTF